MAYKKPKSIEQKLNIQEIWNKELETFKREPKERNYISASDIGKSYLDRWLKMKGVPETNPFEPRVMRIFSAGEQFHWLIRKVFEKIGLLINAEQIVKIPATEKILAIIGYYDLLLGGKVDKQKGFEAIKGYGFSPFIEQKAINLLNFFANEYPNGFEPIICENKSVHSNAFWGFQEGKGYLVNAYQHQELQLYTYLKALNMKEGKLLLISKDDLSLAEYIVKNPTEKLEKLWKEDIETISKYYLENIEPEREPDIVFDETKKKWVSNWKIERSVYLTRITGCKDKNEWLEKIKPELKEKNKEFKKAVKSELENEKAEEETFKQQEAEDKVKEANLSLSENENE